MIDTQTICPYTGLRSFTEEESLYFKGRDIQVDQITALLEQNKFLMVTGASGEGKSSLIYGGLIPNARAGFFKARHTNWVVADFRPERSPVKNMALSLAHSFGRQPSTIETELRRGFSSLVDLYTNSEFYFEEEENGVPQAEREEKRRKAANLLIIIDQFEEFFTNPENFSNESPSQDSQVVVNLALETARIALKRNLPVYVVCTMRSDFIGQCSAFRGLPEYIGFSQFFVPRLKRKDLKQVIEEPAVLSGNRITQRLVERLVFDLAEGIDQLPILQHALSQIWLAADHGREEMDLIHYAMVGGMSFLELPDDDQHRFKGWLESLPEYKRAYFDSNGLNKVIEIHANSLYESAWEYHNNSHPDKPVTRQEAKHIVAMTFACLTKIDNSRAVRNRMTVEEITSIINIPRISAETVGSILSIYREEGNAFIRPFRTEDPSTHQLLPETVLDITHESLIRNWNKLDEWAKTEFEYYTTYLDFRAQLDRWNLSGKKNGYLLPIGPLSYFENWYNKCKPNIGWINRYAETKDLQSLLTANGILLDTREFLRRSARKAAVARAFMKYGTKRIAAFLAIVIMFVLSGFYWFDAEQKQNARVIEQVRAQARNLLTLPEIDDFVKGMYVVTEERYNPGSLIPYLNSLDMKTQASLSVEAYRLLSEFDKHFGLPIKGELIEFLNKCFANPEFEKDPEFALIHRNRFAISLAYDEYYNPSAAKREVLRGVTEANHKLAIHFLKSPELYGPTVPTELNLATQLWLTFGNPGAEAIREHINSVSPFAGSAATATFNLYYPKGNFEPNGRDAIDFNGGYHTLASLYAAVGEVENVAMCFGAIIQNGQKNYFELPRVFNNHINIIGYMYQYGHRIKAGELMKWIGANTQGNPPVTLYRNAVLRAGYINHLYMINIFKQTRSHRGYLHPNLALADRKVYDELMQDFEQAIRETKDADERNYLLAMNYKRKAVFYHKYQFDRNLPVDTAVSNQLFESAIAHYRLIPISYLETKTNITIPYSGDGVRERSYTRKQIFLYPDYMDGWFCRPYHTNAFFVYLKRNNLLAELYQTAGDLESFHLWVAKAYEIQVSREPASYRNDFPLPDKDLLELLEFIDGHPEGKAFDKNLPILILANRFLEKGDSVSGLALFRKLQLSSIQRSHDRYEYLEKVYFLNQMKRLSVNLAVIGRHNLAMDVAERIKQEPLRVFSYIDMAEHVYRKDTSAMAFVYLDSVFSLNNRIDLASLANSPLDNRFILVKALSSIGGQEMNDRSRQILRDFTQNAKTGGMFLTVYGIAREGNYYRAMTSIPTFYTDTQEMTARVTILWQDCIRTESAASAQEWQPMDAYFTWFDHYINYLPN